jgi:metal-responsive CopG/Arc/MetJ family transcriptional regulator
MGDFQKEPFVIKRRGEDGYKMITIRIKEDTLTELDKMATDINCSRNELINIMINYGVKNVIIE